MEQIVIEKIQPSVDCGKYPSKAVLGERIDVTCDIISHGSSILDARIRYRSPKQKRWKYAQMHFVNNDSWSGSFYVEEIGFYYFAIEAWVDTFSTWISNAEKWKLAGEEMSSDLKIGLSLLDSLGQAQDTNIRTFRDLMLLDLTSAINAYRGNGRLSSKIRGLQKKVNLSSSEEQRIIVEPKIAGFASWYELFPRSQGSETTTSGTLKDCISRLDDISEMGFNVLYLTPIFPIGETNRVGRNGSRSTVNGFPGSPWAIGNSSGGHKAINPELGTFADFAILVKRAEDIGIKIALDMAFQCSPDHPYVSEHPEWFNHRPDGSIRYAENPPKKYFDIYPINFDLEDKMPLWVELKSIFEFWIDKGVKIFRVDNPHTKPLDFWEWCISSIKKKNPEVVFLSEAFTRPKLMYALSKAGFSESYTYFTWRNYDFELRDFLTELSTPEISSFFRPMFFVNTPDILPYVLQNGGRNAFIFRAIIAATASPLWGIYSGYELCENDALTGKEEYENSEKYEFRKRDWKAPGNIRDIIGKLNRLRAENTPFQGRVNIRFLPSSNPNILFFQRRNTTTGEALYVAININPFESHTSTVSFPIEESGVNEGDPFKLEDMFMGGSTSSSMRDVVITLIPGTRPAGIYKLTR